MRPGPRGRFKNSFIFKYSPRPGTKADELYADDVPEEVKKRRNNDLLAIQNANSLADHRPRIGQTVEVLVEGPSKTASKQRRAPGRAQLTGRTMTDHIVVFDGNERLIGQTRDGESERSEPVHAIRGCRHGGGGRWGVDAKCVDARSAGWTAAD